MRVDAGVGDGSVVGVHYDPLLAKVIAHAPTRLEAARLLASALAGAHLHGLVTNRDLLVGILRSEAFLAGDTTTGFLDHHPPAELAAGGGSGDPSTLRLHAAAAALAAQAARRAAAPVYPAVPSGWRNNPSQPQAVTLRGRAGVGFRHGRLPLRPPRHPGDPPGRPRPAARVAPVGLHPRPGGPRGRRRPATVRGPPGRRHLLRRQPPRPHRVPRAPPSPAPPATT